MTTAPIQFPSRLAEIELEVARMRGTADGVRDARAIGFCRAFLVAAAVEKKGGLWRVTLVFPDRVEQHEPGAVCYALPVERILAPNAIPVRTSKHEALVSFEDTDPGFNRRWSFYAPSDQALAVQYAIHLITTKEQLL